MTRHTEVRPPNVLICQRFQVFHEWKADKNLAEITFPWNSSAIPGENSPPVGIAIRTYSGPDAPTGITRHWVKIDSPGSFRIGNGFIVDRDSPWPMSADYSAGREGEVDLIIALVVKSEDEIDMVRESLGYFTYLIALLSHDLFEESPKPLGPPQITWHYGEKSSQNHSTMNVPIKLVPHKTLGNNELHSIFDALGRTSAPTQVSTRVLELALKRYSNAQTETDPVDAFCDLWECLEFLSPKENQIRGGIASRISHHLARHIGINKAEIENKWIRPLYSIRKDIIHNADENIDEIRGEISRISLFAKTLIFYHLSVPFEEDRSIFDKAGDRLFYIAMNTNINPSEATLDGK